MMFPGEHSVPVDNTVCGNKFRDYGDEFSAQPTMRADPAVPRYLAMAPYDVIRP